MTRAWHRSRRGSVSAWVDDTACHLPVAFHLCRSGGHVFVLLGNLETGIVGDSRSEREITFTLNRSVLKLPPGRHVLENADDGTPADPLSETRDDITFRLPIAPQGSAIYRLLPCPAGPAS